MQILHYEFSKYRLYSVYFNRISSTYARRCLPLFALHRYQAQSGGPIVIPVSRLPLPGIGHSPDASAAAASQQAATRARRLRRESEQPGGTAALYEAGPTRAAPRAPRDPLVGRLLARLMAPVRAERFRAAYCDAIMSGLKWLKFESAS